MRKLLLVALAVVVAGVVWRILREPDDLLPPPPPVAEDPVEDGIEVQVFFGHRDVTPDDCTTLRPLLRIIPPTEAPARAALQELLRGPTLFEREQGYSTSINPGVRIQRLEIEQGIARVDFSRELDEGVAGSCRVLTIRSEIEQTLLQFDTVDRVVLSVEGEVEEALQP